MAGGAEEFNDRDTRGFLVLARLKPGISLPHAQSEMEAISQHLAQTYPETNEARSVELSPLERETLGELQKPLLVLLAAVGFVLLIAATNVANLLLARFEARHHEIAMRAALGASRGRLIQQFLSESAVLVTCGCLAGLALAQYGIRILMAASPLKFPSFVHPTMDLRVGLLTAMIGGLVVLALGLAPSAQAGVTRSGEALKQGGGGRSTVGTRSSRFREGLVVTEISLSLVLLAGAGLMVRSVLRLAALNPGYDPSHVVHLRVSLPQLQASSGPHASNQADENLVVRADEVLRRISVFPSVESASIATDAPLTGGNAVFYAAEGQPPMDSHNTPRAYFHRVSPGFFRTLHTRLLAGPSFSDDEVRRHANVAIVTENMVQRFWPGQDPIGKRIKVGSLDSPTPWLTIIGVIVEVNYRGLPRNPTADPDLFQVFNESSCDFEVLVRTSLDNASMLAAIRQTLKQTDSSILIYDAGTLEELIGQETALPHFTGWLMTIFAATALILAMIGIFGVMSYRVSRQTREIGLRMALGAGRWEVLRLIVGRGLISVCAGMLLGTAAAVALTRLMATLVFDVSPRDPLTFTLAAALLGAAAVLACILPASRANRIDPAVALRQE
jgi:putative ABC transport system permease protein